LSYPSLKALAYFFKLQSFSMLAIQGYNIDCFYIIGFPVVVLKRAWMLSYS